MIARHDRRTVMLHWATVALVLALWTTAQCIDLFPKGPPRWNARSVHMLLGLALGLVLVRRLVWRMKAGSSAAAGGAAGAVHVLLYLLLFGEVLLGLLNAWVRGDHVFQLFEIPALVPGDKALRATVGAWHENAASALLLVAGLHALAALFHHYVLRDGLLQRMNPKPRGSAHPSHTAPHP